MTPEQDKFCDNNCVWTDHHPDCKLSQQEPEWYHIIDVHGCNRFYHKTEDCPYECRTPLYITPPQRTWVGLTDEEFEQLLVDAKFTRSDLLMIGACVEDICNMVEAKLKEKNNG